MEFHSENVALWPMGKSQAMAHISLPVRLMTRGERLLRAARTLALTWALAGLSIAIPVAHFVLVPGLLLLGPLLGLWSFRGGVVFAPARFPCPRCQNEVEVKEGVTGWPLKLFCRGCSTPWDGKKPISV